MENYILKEEKMFKKFSAALLFSATSALCSAGIIDYGDTSFLPDVNSYSTVRKIVAKYYPEFTVYLPEGLSRHDAWVSDIKKAAEIIRNTYDDDQDIDKDKLDKLIKYVLDPVTSPVAEAPHGRLLEFELYARGKRELFFRNYTELPPAWKTLMDLPLERRRYTTIPVIRAFCSYRMNRGGKLIEAENALKKMISAKAAGCYDTQGCIVDLLKNISRSPDDYDPFERDVALRFMFKKYFFNDPEIMKLNPAANNHLTAKLEFTDRDIDEWDINWVIYLTGEDTFRKMCKSDPFLRDIIVCYGMTNRQMEDARKVAKEFYKESVICYPAAATKMPLDDAIKLLENHPEYSAMRDQFIIKKLEGVEKINAIDEYIAKYPDFAKQSDKNPDIILNTHAVLHALAGAELFKLGKPYEAAARWLKGCTAEDMAMVAEQVMSIDELKRFCDKNLFYVGEEQEIFSLNCDRKDFFSRLEVLNQDQISFMLRNILARRLMRAGRFNEAQEYFTGGNTRRLANKFFTFREKAEDTGSSRAEKLEAMLNMALLVRCDGNRLFGTFLEPDNLICRNNYPCTWGTKQNYVKLNKPDLPRFSYRYRAAEIYAKAAELTDDRNLKGAILWTAGTIIKNRDPEAADVYFKKLYKVAPELTENNWFMPLKKVPDNVRVFYMLGK